MIGQLELAFLLGVRASKRSSLVAEQLTFQ